MLKKIVLTGELGKKFGRVFYLAVNSPAEAVRALTANLPGFDKWLIESGDRGVAYRVFVGKEDIEKDDLTKPIGQQTIKFTPVITGSGAGARIILGIVLVVVGSLTSWAGGGLLVQLGASLIIGGVVQMLTKTPKADGPAEKADNKPSFAFDGPINTVAQGNAVPVCYGEMIVGSQVISTGLFAMPAPVNTPTPATINVIRNGK